MANNRSVSPQDDGSVSALVTSPQGKSVKQFAIRSFNATWINFYSWNNWQEYELMQKPLTCRP